MKKLERIKRNVSIKQDDDGHWYWIPDRLLCEFNAELSEISGIEYMSNPDAFDKFSENYEQYRTGGAPELMPDFFKKYL